MATLTFTGSRPTSRQKSVLVVGQVNAEPITVVVDESWSGLQLELQFFNSTTHPEVPVVVILDRTMTCKVPPEVTKEVGIVHVALAGRDSGTIIKLSEKLYYADAKIGADPQGGLTPEQQTPDYIAQMIAIQEETKAVAQSVRTDANNGLFDGEPGKSPKEEGGTWWLWNEEEQKWVDTGILVAGKNGISPKVETQPVTGGTRVIITDADGEKSFDVLNGKNGNPGKNGETPNITIGKVDTLPSGSKATAEITGQTPNLTLNMGIPQGREGPAGVGVPVPTPEDAGKVPMVNQEGNGYIFGEAGGGGAGGELLLAEYIQQGNQEIYFSSFDWASGIGECTEPHGLTEATQAMLVWNDWMTGNVYANATAMPIEWTSLDQNLFLLPTDDTHVMVVGNDKTTPVTVNASDDFNVDIDATKIHFEVPVPFEISDLPELCIKVQLTILGIVMGNKRYRYTTFICKREAGGDLWVNTINLLHPPYFGAITKPRHGIFTSHNITIDLNDVCGASFLYSNYLIGRRNNYVGFPGETYTEINRAIQPYNAITKLLGVKSIQNAPAYAVWANGTRMRVYGLCKRGDGK